MVIEFESVGVSIQTVGNVERSIGTFAGRYLSFKSHVIASNIISKNVAIFHFRLLSLYPFIGNLVSV